jgi:hypothetical protein
MAEFLSRIRVVNGNIVDLAGNNWDTSNVSVQSDTSIFAPYIVSTGGAGMALNDSIVSSNSSWTISFWANCTNNSGVSTLLNFPSGNSVLAIRYGVFGFFESNYTQFTPLTSAYSEGWHHVALVNENNVCKIAVDGVFYSNTFTYTLNFSSINGFGLLTTSSVTSYIFDFCIIDGIALWTEDFTPPTSYLILQSYAYLSNNSLYTGTSLTNLTSNWSGLTNSEKETLVESFSGEIPSIQDLATISPFRVFTNDTSLENVKVTGQPKPQTIEPTSLINTGAVSTLQSINITNTIIDATVKFAITTDLTTYKVYDAIQGDWVASINIEEDGMSIAQINALTPEILELLDVSNGIAFKQCFIATSENALAELSEISAVVDIDGSWSQSIHGTDYNVAYPNKTTMSVRLLTNGDYIINYSISE